MFGELFKQLAKVDMLFVGYKGEAPAINDAMGGQISVVFANLPSALPLVQGGRLRALAVTSANRVSSAPQIPTAAESGLRDFTTNSWFGLYAPAATPRPIVNRINTESAAALNVPEVKERLAVQGMFVVANTPEQFAAFLKTEVPRWTTVVKVSGVKP